MDMKKVNKALTRQKSPLNSIKYLDLPLAKSLIDWYFQEIEERKPSEYQGSYDNIAREVNDHYNREGWISNFYFITLVFPNKHKSKRKNEEKVNAIIEYLTTRKKDHDRHIVNDDDAYTEAELITETEDSVKTISGLEALSQLIKYKQFDKAEEHYNAEKLLIENSTTEPNKEYQLAKLDFVYSKILGEHNSDYEKQDEVLVGCLKIFERLGTEDEVYEVKLDLAKAKGQCSDFNTAQFLFEEYIKYKTSKADYHALAKANLYAGILQELINSAKALKHYDLSIENYKLSYAFGTKDDQINALYELGECYLKKSIILKRLGRVSESTECITLADNCAERFTDKLGWPKVSGKVPSLMDMEDDGTPQFLMKEIADFLSNRKADKNIIATLTRYAKGLGGVPTPEFDNNIEEIVTILLQCDHDTENLNIVESLAHLLKDMKSYELAARCFRYLTKLPRRNKFAMHIVHGYLGLVMISDEIHLPEQKSSFLESAEKILNHQLSISRKTTWEHLWLQGLVAVYMCQDNYLKAIDAIEQLCDIFKTSDEYRRRYIQAKLQLADAYDMSKNIPQAYKNWNEVIGAPKNKETDRDRFSAFVKLCALYYQFDNFEMAQNCIDAVKVLERDRKNGKDLLCEIIENLLEEKKILTNHSKVDLKQILSELDSRVDDEAIYLWLNSHTMFLRRLFYYDDSTKALLYCNNFNWIEDVVSSLSWLFDRFIVRGEVLKKTVLSDSFGTLVDIGPSEFDKEFIKVFPLQDILKYHIFPVSKIHLSANGKLTTSILHCRLYNCCPIFMIPPSDDDNLTIVSRIEFKLPAINNSNELAIKVKKLFNSLIFDCRSNKRINLPNWKLEMLDILGLTKCSINIELRIYEVIHVEKLQYPVILIRS